MKNKIFFPIIGALVCLLPAFGTKPNISKLPVSAAPDAKDNVSPTVSTTLSCPLPAPDSFNGERTSGTTAALSWSTVPNAVAYRLIVKDLDTDEVIVNSLEYGTSRSLSGLDPGTSYRCVLASVCLGGTTSDYIIATDILE